MAWNRRRRAQRPCAVPVAGALEGEAIVLIPTGNAMAEAVLKYLRAQSEEATMPPG